MTDNEPLGLGLIGCGAFGLFGLEAFSRMDGVRLVAAARARKPAARETCRRLGAATFDDPSAVLTHPGVDVVHVATPPHRHCPIVLAALAAGKHVLCEKPLALCMRDAQRMVRAARRADRFLATSFVMRYSPVTDAVRRVLDAGVLGRVLAGSLINCGSDSGLGEDHWFWDPERSGGIFVEHGVHFFDLYAAWLGPGRALHAHARTRGPAGPQDRVTCVVRHEGASVSHYHGFDQIARMDRTAHRLVCEMGDVHVDGWIPQAMTLDAAVDATQAEGLADCCRPMRVDVEVLEQYDPGDREVLGRGKVRRVLRRVRLSCRTPQDKQTLYADCLRDLLADQVAWLHDRDHARRVTEDAGLAALACAETARELADARGD